MSSSVDPTTLTKEKLKKELSDHNVALPSPSARKDVFVDLYRSHVINQTQRSEFSSDDDEGLGNPKQTVACEESAMVQISAMTDQELFEALKAHGQNPGPILDSTRKVYQRKLARLMDEVGVQEADLVTPHDMVDAEYSDEDVVAVEEPVRTSSTRRSVSTTHSSSQDTVILTDSSQDRYMTQEARQEPRSSSRSSSHTSTRQSYVQEPDYVREPVKSYTREANTTYTREPARSYTREPVGSYAREPMGTYARERESTWNTSATTSVTRSRKTTKVSSDAKPEAPAVNKAKKGSSIVVQIVVMIVAAAIIYLVFQNMESSYTSKSNKLT